ncbi:ADP-ribosylglycohydrolase family protein [Micrococcales bacterium 31B]|nr:ADP-ribosylglycohydrolase family protein [Micrococcales bacterium 31B]
MERIPKRSRGLGAVLGGVVGDVLGVPYSYTAVPAQNRVLGMSGGGVHGLRPGYWTSCSDLSLIVGLVASKAQPAEPFGRQSHLDDISQLWFEWHRGGKEPSVLVGRVLQCAAVFAQDEDVLVPRALHLQRAAAQCYSQSYRADCSGSLTRAHMVAVATLDQSIEQAVLVTRQIHSLTHVDPDAGEAVVLWTLMVREACLEGTCEPRNWLAFVPDDRRDLWRDRIEAAELSAPRMFGQDDWSVHAFQSAWSAVFHSAMRGAWSPEERTAAFTRSMHSAVSFSTDCEVVASIAGGLAGALFGLDAINPRWLRALHGWPGWSGGDIMSLAERMMHLSSAADRASLVEARPSV